MMKSSTWIAIALFLSAPSLSATTLSGNNASSVYGFWPVNPTTAPKDDAYRFAILSDRYAMSVSARTGCLDGFMSIAPSEFPRLRESRSDIENWITPVQTRLWIEVGDSKYFLVGASRDPMQPNRPLWHGLRLIEGGNHLQHFKILHLDFLDEDGNRLEGFHADLEFACWSDLVVCTLNYVSETDHDMLNGHTDVRIGWDVEVASDEDHRFKRGGHASIVLENQKDHESTTILSVEPSVPIQTEGNKGGFVHRVGSLPAWEEQSLTFLLIPQGRGTENSIENVLASEDLQIAASDLTDSTLTQKISTRFDRSIWGHRILVEGKNDRWINESYEIQTLNPTPQSLRARIILDRRPGNDRSFPSIFGTSGFLSDSETGEPMGDSIQVSKNWHTSTAWVRCIARPTLPPTSGTIDFNLVFAKWADSFAVSHAQLSLIGYLANQQWDQVAVGSFGEQITYDPYYCLGRSFIDDIRPLLVTSMGSGGAKWGWTVNVGGADFLVAETVGQKEGWRNLPHASITDYRRVGPVLTEVTYDSDYLEGRVRQKATAFSWKSDDFFRVVYHLKTEFLDEIDISRLAFFQMGADRYNDNVNGSMAIGDQDGMIEHWVQETGGLTYSRRGKELVGERPWIAFLDARPDEERHKDAAWPNRVLILHDWKAKLGGRRAGPHYSVYGTDNGPAAALAEISPPTDIHRLEKGDFVEAWIELAVVPQKPEDYYGGNPRMESILAESSHPWEACYRVANSRPEKVEVLVGTLEREYLPVIRCEGNAADVKIHSGWGWHPIVFTGLDRIDSLVLEQNRGESWVAIDPSAEGPYARQVNFNSETGTWEFVYTLELEPERTVHLRLRQTTDRD